MNNASINLKRGTRALSNFFFTWVRNDISETDKLTLFKLEGINRIAYQITWDAKSEGIERLLSIIINFTPIENGTYLELEKHVNEVDNYSLYVVLEDKELKIREIFLGKNIVFEKDYPKDNVVRCRLSLFEN